MRIVPVAVLALAAVFLLSLDATVVRQASVVGMGDCSIRQFVNLPQNVDLLALGSSRVRTGISTEAIVQASGGRLRSNFNFGRSGLSALRSYITLRDAVDRGVRPRFIFMEVDLDALQDTNVSSPIKMPGNVAFMKYADLGVMLEAPHELRMSAKTRLYLLTLLDKVRGSIIPVLAMDPLWGHFRAPGPPVASCQDRADSDITERGRAELEAVRQRELVRNQDTRSMHRAFRPGAAESPLRQQELLFIGKVRELARKLGAVLVVARQGSAYEAPLSDDAIAQIRRDTPEFAQPPDDVVRASWAHFTDAAHMGPRAREIYSAWLAQRLLTVASP